MKEKKKKIPKGNKKKRIIFLSLASTIIIAAVAIPTAVVASFNWNENETNVKTAISQFNEIQITNNKISANVSLNNFPSLSVNQNNLSSYLQNLPTMNSLFAKATNYKILPKDFFLSFSLVPNSYSSNGTSLKINVTFSSNIGIAHYSKTVNNIEIDGFNSSQVFLNNSIKNINNAISPFSLNTLVYAEMNYPKKDISENQLKQLLMFNPETKPANIFLSFVTFNIINIIFNKEQDNVSFNIQLNIGNYSATTKILVLQLN